MRLVHSGLNDTRYKMEKHATGGWSCSQAERVERILVEAERRKLVKAPKNED